MRHNLQNVARCMQNNLVSHILISKSIIRFIFSNLCNIWSIITSKSTITTPEKTISWSNLMSIKQLCELHPHLQEYHKICSLQLLCHLSRQHFLSLPTQNTENVLQAEGWCNFPLPVKISFKVQNFHFQLSLFVDSIFYILVAKMVRYSQDIIIELQSGLEAWPERFSRPDCPHGTLCAWLTHAHNVLCAWHTHVHVRVAVSRARILYTKTPPGWGY